MRMINEKAALGGLSCPASSELTLGELLPATSFAQTDLLTFDFARIASNQPRLAQRGFQVCIVVDQGTSDAVTDSTGLAGFAATGDVHHDVELADHVGQLQRLAHDHAACLTGKEHIHRLVVNNDVALAGLDEHTCHRALATACSVVISYAHD